MEHNNTVAAILHLGWQGGTIWQVAEATGLTADEIHNSKDIIKSIEERKGFNLSPRYKHDCSRCSYLGQYKNFDLYCCEDEPTILCRYSSEGPDYNSGLCFAFVDDVAQHAKYVECLRRALLIKRYREAICTYICDAHISPIPYVGSSFQKLNFLLEEGGYRVS